MALLTDDMDITETYLRTMLGGNGDYYLQLIEVKNGIRTASTVRISTSGGNAPSAVKIAAAGLYRAMEKHNLNEYPD